MLEKEIYYLTPIGGSTINQNTNQRVRIASAMAATGPEWFDYFSRNHSGTYANQYMIANMNLFEPNEILKNDTLWVVEEAPGIVVGSDQTDALRLSPRARRSRCAATTPTPRDSA